MKSGKSLSDKFLSIYNELDSFMRKNLNAESFVDHTTLLKNMSDKNRLFSSYFRDLKTFADLRNILVHNPYRANADPLFELHSYVVDKYEDIKNQVLHPPKALSIAVPRELIYTTTLGDNALDVMQVMDEKTYTHIPVFEGDRLVGVFSENTVLSYLVSVKDAIIPKETKIEEFLEFIPLNKHRSEYFEFVARSTLLSDVEEIFRKNLKQRKRVAVVFITETGKPTEKVLGLITAWDIAGKDA